DVIRFDRGLMSARLAELPCEARVAFALACAERLQPSATYLRDRSAVALVRRILDLTFDAISSPSAARSELAELSQTLEAAPFVDDDAAASTAFALRCHLSGAAEDAMRAAKRAYEARDYEAQQDPDYISADEIMLLAHPNVQEELFQQQTDLD